MTDLNSVDLIGRICQDAENVPNEKGVSVARFAIAVNRDYKDKGTGNYVEYTSFIDLALTGSRAESLKKYLTKGTLISVEGYLKQDRWEKDGQKFSKLVVLIDKINPFLERKNKPTAIETAAAKEETIDLSVDAE